MSTTDISTSARGREPDVQTIQTLQRNVGVIALRTVAHLSRCQGATEHNLLHVVKGRLSGWSGDVVVVIVVANACRNTG
eukprot:2223922-Pleurochrysis_carterae.AAC.1